MFCVTVVFTLKAGKLPSFLTRMRIQRDDSLSLEQGCREFHVWTGHGQPDTVFLYELYASADDFEAHLASDHFRSFDKAVRDMVADRTIQRWESLQ